MSKNFPDKLLLSILKVKGVSAGGELRDRSPRCLNTHPLTPALGIGNIVMERSV